MTAPFIRKESSPFQKRILVPFWVFRIIILVAGIGIYGLGLGVLIAYNSDLRDYEREYNTNLAIGVAQAVLAVVLILLLICFVLEIVTVIKRSRRTLSPKLFLIVNVLQSAFVVVMFILSMIGARTPGSVALSVVIL